MNARIRKEIRSLGPWSLVAALVLVALPVVGDLSLLSIVFGIACVLIGVEVFGRELSSAAMGQLLSQPVRRAVLWREKMWTGAAACLVLTLCLWGLLFWHGTFWTGGAWALESARLRSGLYAGVIMPFAGVALGSFFLLWSRQVIGSFWFALAAIWLVLFGAGELAMAMGQGEARLEFGAVALAAVTVAALVLARKRFLSYEEGVAVWGFVLGDRTWRRAKAGVRESAFRVRPLRALLGKELRLQQLNVACLGGLYLMAAGLWWLAARPERADSAMREMVPLFARFVSMIAPLAVGALAVAEERNRGTMPWHGTLPVSRLRQVVAKLGTAVALAVLLGFVPGLLLDYGIGFFPLVGRIGELPKQSAAIYPVVSFLFTMVCVTGGYYASSLSRGYIQAIAVTFGLAGMVMVWAAFLYAMLKWQIRVSSPWVFVVVCALFIIGYFAVQGVRNSFLTSLFGTVWKRNMIGLAVVLAVCGSVNAFLYHRAWEVVLQPSPADPKYGDGQGRRSQLSASRFGNEVSIIPPDGTLWHWGSDYREAPKLGTNEFDAYERDEAKLYQVSAETNWQQVIDLPFGLLALRGDGTLWGMGVNERLGLGTLGLGDTLYVTNLTQVGAEQEWKRISSSLWYTLAVSEGGELWGWGKNVKNILGTVEENVTVKEPLLLDERRVWRDVVSTANGENFVLHEDGSIWVFGSYHPADRLRGGKQSDWEAVTSPVRWIQGSNSVALHAGESFVAALQENGSTWLWKYGGGGRAPHYIPLADGGELPENGLHLSDEVQWDTLQPDWASVFYLSRDGELVRGLSPDVPVIHSLFPYAMPEGDHWSAFLLLSMSGRGMVAMTEDGSLWHWGATLDQIRERHEPWLPFRQRPHRVAKLVNDP